MKPLNLTCFFILFWVGGSVLAQEVDSLSKKSNRYLVSKLDSFQFNRQDTLVWVYLDAYIENAKERNDYETLYYGYREAIYFSDGFVKKSYADSAISISQKLGKPEIEGNAYLLKGRTLYGFKDYKGALDNYIKANEIIKETQDNRLQNSALYAIAVIKIYLGYFEDAMSLIDEAMAYFAGHNNPDDRLSYLRCLYRKGEVFQKTGNFKKASETNLLGLQESLKYNEKIQEQYFNFAIGIDDYFRKDYALSIKNIQKSLPAMIENQYFDLEAKGHFYIAKSYLGLGQEEKAISHFRKVDSIFIQNRYLDSEIRESYEWLINYYKRHHNKDLQLYYVNQLLEVDRVSAENNKYLAYKINKEYDTKTLLETKQKLEERFTVWQRYSFWIIGLLFLISIVILVRYLRLREKNKALREQYELTLQQEPNAIEKTKNKLTDIPQETVDEILNRLENFEKSKEFLNPRLDQKWLADKFKTNSAYLSKVINSYKENNFSGYVNHLRIRYLIQTLKNEPKYRQYTIQALGELCGYSSSRHFSDAFLAETKLRPTYFMEQMQKEKDEPIAN